MTVRKIGETAVHSPLKRVSLLVFAVIFFVSVTAFAVPPSLYSVTIYDGDSAVVVMTSQADPYDVLEDAGISVNENHGDEVSLKAFTGFDNSAIVIRRGVKVFIESFDGSKTTLYCAGRVKDAIEKSGIKLAKGTALSHSADEMLTEGMKIEIYGIYKVTVEADGKTVTKKVSGKTVAHAIDAFGIKMEANDFTEPEMSASLKNGMTITVNRVTVKSRTEKESVPYDTEYTYSDSLYNGHQKVLSAGQTGEKAVVYEDRYVNGELVKSTAKSEKIIKDSVKEVVQVGTRVSAFPSSLPVGTPISELSEPSYLEVGSNGVPTKYKSVINAQATAYCIPGGITSTGKRAQTGYIAVDPKEIPYGTEMYIVSADGRYVYGYCIAADTGSYIYDVDWTVDLYMNSEAQCRNWGRRDIIIYVL